ncbi:MAG TPA: hypothetical protein VLL08_28940 [Kineosporiaceae bacterium]|nr:hypothetical protein [Kineosporiaceae bacterium]
MRQGVMVADRSSTAQTLWHRISGTGPLQVIAALAAALAIWASAEPLDDYDAFLHVELGGQILSKHRVGGLSADWLGVPQPPGWITSQWLAEVIMHLVTGVSWHALLALRVLVTVAFVAALAGALLPGRPAPVAVPIFGLSLAGVVGALDDRPQTAGLLFLVGLGPICVRLWTTGRRPPVAVVALAVLVWAQLHGTWILAPAGFLLVAIGLQLDAGRRPAPHLRAALTCVLAALAGVLNPQGLTSFILPVRFSRASSMITEWWPTTLAAGFALSWATVVLATVLAWARSTLPVPRVEVLWVLGWTAFGVLSYRNVPPALLMTAPAAVSALTRWYSQGRTPETAAARRPGLESQLLASACALLVVGSTIVALIRVPSIDPFATTPGHRIAAWIAAQPGPVRVFNAWNASGALIGLSNGKARLVIDSRVDLWGRDYMAKIGDAELMSPGWERTVADFRPDAVVIPRTSALVSGLTLTGWQITITDGDLVLLLPSQRPNVRHQSDHYEAPAIGRSDVVGVWRPEGKAEEGDALVLGVDRRQRRHPGCQGPTTPTALLPEPLS